jgi:hypothetical protein
MNFDTVPWNKATISNVSVSTSSCNMFKLDEELQKCLGQFSCPQRTSVDIESMNRVMCITMHWYPQSLLGLFIVLEVFFGFWCSHKVPNDASHVLFKFPCVAQSVPHGTTLYLIFCSHIYPHKWNSLTKWKAILRVLFSGNAHSVNVFSVYSQLKEAHRLFKKFIKSHFELVPTTNRYH